MVPLGPVGACQRHCQTLLCGSPPGWSISQEVLQRLQAFDILIAFYHIIYIGIVGQNLERHIGTSGVVIGQIPKGQRKSVLLAGCNLSEDDALPSLSRIVRVIGAPSWRMLARGVVNWSTNCAVVNSPVPFGDTGKVLRIAAT